MSEERKLFQDETAGNQRAGEINNNTEQNEIAFQWTAQRAPAIPIPVSSSVTNVVFNGSSPYNQQQFVPTNNIGNIFNLPNNNGNRFGNGLPSTSNGVHNGYTSWVIPVANTSRFLSRPETNPTTRSSTCGVRKLKRIRTAFTAMQMVVLEQEYKKNNFLDRVRRTSLAEMLGLNERVIKIWFQNRRMKDKKVKPDTNNLEEEASSTTGLPFVTQNQQTGEVFNRNVYEDQYLTTSTTTCAIPMPIQQIPMLAQVDQLPMVNGYRPHYIPQEYDPYQQQVHLQIQHYGPSPAYSNRLQEIVNDSPPLQEETSSPPDAVIKADPNLDISWVNNINIDEDC